MVSFLASYFAAPLYLWLLILPLIGLLILWRSHKNLAVMRVLILVFLILALAEPYSPLNFFREGNAKIELLDDQSASYELFDTKAGERTYERLKEKEPLKYQEINEEQISNIGDAMIGSLESGNHILLFSDGQITEGAKLEEVKEVALQKNKSISWVKQELKEKDHAVEIIGPSKVGPNTKSVFTVQVSGTDDGDKAVELSVNGKVVMTDRAGSYTYETEFNSGYHKLEARILTEDANEENNVFYKTVKVVEKPRVLLFGQENTPLHRSLSKLYDVRVGGLRNLESYHTIVIDNQKLSSFEDKIPNIIDYVEKGNGLVVMGGGSAYEYGDYENSAFEAFLPADVGAVAKKEGDVNIVVALDISSSTGSSYGLSTAAEVGKSLALSVLENIADEHNLGVIAFNTEATIVEPLGLLEEKDKAGVETLIRSLDPSGSTSIGQGLLAAKDMLNQKSGGKNIILITDGSNSQGDVDAAITSVKNAGIKIYSIGVGSNPNSGLLNRASGQTGGTYYQALQSHQLSFVFGDPEQQTSKNSVIQIEDDKHFITEGLILNTQVGEVNQIIPKDAAQLLINTGEGDPLLTVWRRGLGRVAVLATDNGQSWAGELYKGANSRILSRTVNWASGDPERKNSYFFSVSEARVGEPIIFTIKGDKAPKVEGLRFERLSDGQYQAEKMAEAAGFFTFLDDEYSVVYAREYEEIGNNDAFDSLIHSSGGTIYATGSEIQNLAGKLGSEEAAIQGQEEAFIWPFVLLALLSFLLDVWFRTLAERKNI